MDNPYKILCIGVNQSPAMPLAEKNAAAVASYCMTLKSKYPVTLLLGESATLQRVNRWTTQCNCIKGNINVIVYFSGASTLRQQTGRPPQQTISLCNHQLPLRHLLDALDNPNHRLILLLDVHCAIPTTIPGNLSVPGLNNAFKENLQIVSFKPYAVISSMPFAPYPSLDPSMPYTIFTHYLLKILSGDGSFFLTKKISLLDFITLLRQKIKNHRFTSSTNRRFYLPAAKTGSLPVHLSDDSFSLPIMEPVPPHHDFYSPNPIRRFFAQLRHCLTSTRFLGKLSLLASLLVVILIPIVVVRNITLRIHFEPRQAGVIYNSLMSDSLFEIPQLYTSSLGLDAYKELDLYLFKANWTRALAQKLDENGKIVLMGNMLGRPLKNISPDTLMSYCLAYPEQIFYWHPNDLKTLLERLEKNYHRFNVKRKLSALILLKLLGTKGKKIARRIINLKKDTDSQLRKLILTYYYTPRQLETYSHLLDHHDYLFLMNHNIKLSPVLMQQSRTRINRYLEEVIAKIANRRIPLTDRRKLDRAYQKLDILAKYRSSHFRTLALKVFNTAFDPWNALNIYDYCRDLKDKIWLLEQFIVRTKHIPLQMKNDFWSQLLWRYAGSLPKQEKARILKLVMDNMYHLVPQSYHDDLLRYLQGTGNRTVTLKDWKRWIRTYQIEPSNTFASILAMRYENIFPFLHDHLDYFSTLYSGRVFEILKEINETQTIKLAETIEKSRHLKDRFAAALFLVSYHPSQHLPFIIDVMQKARHNGLYRDILLDYSGPLNTALIQLIETFPSLKEKFKATLKLPQLSYRLFSANLHFWPQQVIQRMHTTPIPLDSRQGIPFMRCCEKLPEPFRKQLMIKICKADIDTHFRLNSETRMKNFYPREFLDIGFDPRYNYSIHTRNHILEACQLLSYTELKEKLIQALKRSELRKIDCFSEAITMKAGSRGFKLMQLKTILNPYKRPVQRMVLRSLRYHLHMNKYREEHL